MKTFFYLLVLLLPTQLGRHFWPNFSFIQGIRVDYLSPTIYVTDVLIILFLIVWIISNLNPDLIGVKSQIPKIWFNKLTILSRVEGRLKTLNLKQYWPLLVLITSIIIGINHSTNPQAGIYAFVKLIEFILLGFWVAKNVKLKKEIKTIIILLSIGIIFESALAILQFANQSSLGGIFWLFGERTFNVNTPGIADFVNNGQLILRPYGTFSHPNVLAGFLVVAMTLAISNLTLRQAQGDAEQSRSIKNQISKIALGIGTVALIITMSRVAIVSWLVILTMNLVKRFPQMIFIIFVATVFLWPRFGNLSAADESFARRGELNSATIEMGKGSPIFGVGLNNFLVNLPNYQKTKSFFLYLQPAHNIYLLVLAETGIIGLSIFIWFILSTIKKLLTYNLSLVTSLIVILVLGIFDHYWLTLQQGQLLFTLILGLSWAKQ